MSFVMLLTDHEPDGVRSPVRSHRKNVSTESHANHAGPTVPLATGGEAASDDGERGARRGTNRAVRTSTGS